ncbi:hypothetical protein MesoLjLc_77580 [Mesorhizobium sp. L-8-10]|uniref:DUF1127 domain-containing protein n=1 Tax=Mesorhizobium sp. L-8-10 TaxID=2744523 RepID=UPI00192650FA|nr:DUF1127 domain-containing protein [Mesorhizobium sp. L-8-10]BCH35828.1 hypothetical protein MesoLjLc_77580 [Mesorhizobium sp. L-8-10]
MSTLASEPINGGIGKILAASVVAAWRAFRSYRARRLTMLKLSELNDHELKDIGITRSEIVSIAYGSPGQRRRSHDSICF